MQYRAYRIRKSSKGFRLQYRFLGLFWYTRSISETFEEAEHQREGDEIIRWFLQARREYEKHCEQEVEKFHKESKARG